MTEDQENFYDEREQTEIKHFMLKRYLGRFAHIVASAYDAITYVDCFAGPWEARSKKLEDTSFSIAIHELKKARDTHKSKQRNIRLRCFFIEKDAQAFARLSEFVASQTGVEFEIFNGELVDAIPKILEFIKAGGSRNMPFIFVDPKGWTGFPLSKITPLLRLAPGEVLINFMTSHIRRFIEIPEQAENMKALFGQADVAAQVAGLDGEDRDDALVKIYSDSVKAAGRYKFVFPAMILEPKNDRTHFHLIYCTRNDLGIEVFKDTERTAMEKMEKARASAYQRKQEHGRQGYLFGPAEAQTSNHYNELRDRYTKKAHALIENRLSTSGSMSYDEAWLEVSKFPLTWERDLREWIAEMVAKKQLRIDGMKPNERSLKRRNRIQLIWLAK
jgi:three-Cys-motif partner protein